MIAAQRLFHGVSFYLIQEPAGSVIAQSMQTLLVLMEESDMWGGNVERQKKPLP